MSTTGTGPIKPKCWGCECAVPRDDRGMHAEETDMPGVVYTYPCAAWGDEAGARVGGERGR